MGEAKRKREAGVVVPPPKPVDDNITVSELVHMNDGTSERISKALAFVNLRRAEAGKKPLPRSLFIGYTLLPRVLAAFEADQAIAERGDRLVLSPDEIQRPSIPATGYVPHRTPTR